MATTEDVLQSAMELPVSERAKVAAELLKSLEADSSGEELSEQEWARQWAAEAKRRFEKSRDNPADWVTWDELQSELRLRRGGLNP